MNRYTKSPWTSNGRTKGKRTFLTPFIIFVFLGFSGFLFSNISASGQSLLQEERVVTTIQDSNSQGSVDTFHYDPSKVSPRGAVEYVDSINSMSEATRFLSAGRWTAHPVPTSQILEIDNVSSLLNPLESAFTQMGMTIGSTLGVVLMTLVSLSFSSILVDFFVNVADRITASFAGLPLIPGSEAVFDLSNPGTGNTVVIISSLFTIALFTTGYRSVISVTGRSLNQRIVAWGISMTKFVVILGIAITVAIQSRANHANASEANVNISIVDSSSDAESRNTSNIEWSSTSGTSQPSSTTGSRTVGNPGSWKPLSMGWIISMVYYFSNIFMGAVVDLFTALVKVPIDYVTRSFVYAGESNSGNGYSSGDACHRYLDAMHLAFSRTPASGSGTAASTVLLAYDQLYYSLFYAGYSQIYGGDTSSSQNSWCWALEVANPSISPGEWAMLSRSAGLYKEALGAGNLLYQDPSQYVDGSHMENVLVPGVAPRDGLLIKSNGDFNGAGEDYVIRLSRYMGRESATGANQAKYYFAACEWPLAEQGGRLSAAWKGVRGMGETGGSSDTSQQVSRESIDASGVQDSARAVVEGSTGVWNEGDYWDYFLTDADCVSPTVVPIGAGDGESNFGFGTGSIVAQRWEFTPLKDSILSQGYSNVRDSVVSSGSQTGAIFKGAEKVAQAAGLMESSEERAAKNPEVKFGSNIASDGTRPAYEFWKRANGTAGGANLVTSLLTNIAIIIFAAFLIIMLIPAFIVNMVLSVLFILVPTIMVVSFIMFIIRGAQGKAL